MSPADSPFASLPAPGPHPATAELRAYAAGTLDAAAQHRIEAHALDCERCADVLAGLAMSDAATTNDAVAELRSRLHSRIGEARPVPAAGRRAWPRVAAAAVLLGAVGASLWGWEQSTTPEAAEVATARIAATAPAASEPQAEVALAPATSAVAITTAPADAQAAPRVAQANDYAAVLRPSARAQEGGQERKASAAPAIAEDREFATMKSDDDLAATVAAPNAVAAAPSELAGQSAPTGEPAGATEELTDASKAKKAAYQDQAGAVGDSVSGARMALDGRLPRSQGWATMPAAAAARVAATPMAAAPTITPAPVGGSRALREYLRREAASFEPELNATRLTGTVRLRVLVGADGKITELKVTRGLRPDYDAEALRLVCDGPAWQPGIAGGRRAALPVEVVVPF